MLQGGKPFRDITANSWDPGVRLAECDEVGVGVQVLSTVPVMFSYWAKPEHTHDLAQLLNDHLAGRGGRAPQALHRPWHRPVAGHRPRLP